MSKLRSSIKVILSDHILPGKRVLELFPGSNFDSIAFLFQLTGKKVVAIGDQTDRPKPSPFLKYYQRVVPPYPKFWRKFDYIFLNEAEWLICVEGGFPVDYRMIPHQGVMFIQNNLKSEGKFIISKIHNSVARLFLKWLNTYCKYTLYYEKDVAIFTKRS